MARTVRGEGFEVIPGEIVSAADAQGLLVLVNRAATEALLAIGKQLSEGDQGQDLRVTVTIEGEME